MELIVCIWLIRRMFLGKWPFEMLAPVQPPAPPKSSGKPNLTVVK